MFTEYHPAAGETASTPESWARWFARSGRLNRWKEFRLGLKREARLVRRYLRPGGLVLDAGCGYGEWVMFLSHRGWRTHGLDYSDELIARLAAEYPEAKWTNADIRAMPSSWESTFDGLISWGVIEHDPAGPQAALREFRRVLKTGGVAILTVPMDSARFRESSRVQFPSGNVFFQYAMTTDDLARFLKETGFNVIEVGTSSPSLPVLVPRLFLRFRGTLGWRVLELAFSFLGPLTRRFDGLAYVVAERPA